MSQVLEEIWFVNQCVATKSWNFQENISMHFAKKQQFLVNSQFRSKISNRYRVNQIGAQFDKSFIYLENIFCAAVILMVILCSFDWSKK